MEKTMESQDEPLLFDAIGYIRSAAGNVHLRALARDAFAELITGGDLLAYQGRKRQVRPSDFGACAAALQSTIQGRDTIVRDPIDDQLTRLDFGSMVGAWEACLLLAACHAEGVWVVRLEYEPEGGGHIDALARRTVGDPQSVVVEFKSGYDDKPPQHPATANMSHCLQASDYALRPDVRADTVLLVYLKPCAPKEKRMAQFAIDPRPYAPLIVAERARLASALLEEQAQFDPQARWSCFTCLAGWCNKNKNKAAEAADALFS